MLCAGMDAGMDALMLGCSDLILFRPGILLS